MVRIVLCVLCLVALALPVYGQVYQPPSTPYYIDPFQPRPQERSTGDRFFEELQRQTQENEQYNRDYRNQREQKRVDETNCFYGRGPFGKCL